MSERDQNSLEIAVTIALGAGLLVWGYTGNNWDPQEEIHRLKMALGAMLTVGGFVWRSRS